MEDAGGSSPSAPTPSTSVRVDVFDRGADDRLLEQQIERIGELVHDLAAFVDVQLLEDPR